MNIILDYAIVCFTQQFFTGMKTKILKFQKRLYSIVLMISLPILGNSQDEGNILMQAVDISYLNLDTKEQVLVDRIEKSNTTIGICGLNIKNIPIKILSSKEILTLSLPGFSSLLFARPKSYEYVSENDYRWYGEFDILAGEIILIHKNGFYHGLISIEGKAFEFRTLVKDKNILIENYTEELSKNGDLPARYSINQQPLLDRQIEASYDIDILVLYTPNAEDYCSDLSLTIDDHAEMAIYQMQAALDISVPDTDITINIADVDEFNFSEQWSDIESDWDSLYTHAQGLRNSTDADLVVLITDADNYMHLGYWVSGLGYVYGYVDQYGPDEGTAFAIVEAHYAYNNHTFAHEVGHLFGCDHEGTGGYNHGYHFTGNSEKSSNNYRTIMHLPLTGYTRITRYSNPDVYYSGVPIGVNDANDNARQIENAAPSIAAFRPYSKQKSAEKDYGILSNRKKNESNSLIICPNPISELTSIQYKLDERCNVQIRILDLTGRVCKSIFEGQQSKGIYDFNLGIVDFDPGIYLCYFTINDIKMMEKLVVE